MSQNSRDGGVFSAVGLLISLIMRATGFSGDPIEWNEVFELASSNAVERAGDLSCSAAKAPLFPRGFNLRPIKQEKSFLLFYRFIKSIYRNVNVCFHRRSPKAEDAVNHVRVISAEPDEDEQALLSSLKTVESRSSASRR